MRIVLPYPVSANVYWRSRTVLGKDKGRGRRAFTVTYVSEEAKAYKQDVGWRLKAAGHRTPLQGRVEVRIELYPKLPLDHVARKRKRGMDWDDDVQCMDLDNARKVLLDALKGFAYEDDAQVWKDSAERMEPVGEACVVVTVEPIVRIAPQIALELPAPMKEGVPF